MYEKEVVEQERKIERMKAEGKDEYDIKKQVTLYCTPSLILESWNWTNVPQGRCRCLFGTCL